MGFKKIEQNLGFADFALASSLKHNRSLKLMEKLDKAIEWSRVEEILMNHYTIGTSNEGADAYPPLMLFKCLMLQKLFNIDAIGDNPQKRDWNGCPQYYLYEKRPLFFLMLPLFVP